MNLTFIKVLFPSTQWEEWELNKIRPSLLYKYLLYWQVCPRKGLSQAQLKFLHKSVQWPPLWQGFGSHCGSLLQPTSMPTNDTGWVPVSWGNTYTIISNTFISNKYYEINKS